MNYKKGQILTYVFPPRPIEEIKNNKVIANYNKSKVVSDYHRVVVLHTRTTPYKTVLVAPITSASGLFKKDSVPNNYVKVAFNDYLGVLDHDSFINLDMVMPVDEKELNDLERFNKKINAYLSAEDIYNMDFKLALTYELQDFLQSEVNNELKQEFENVVEYIDKDIREKVNEIIKKIQDPEIKNLLNEIIDNDLIGVLKSQYLEK